MGFKYWNHPLAMPDHEVDRLNKVLDMAHVRNSNPELQKFFDKIAEIEREARKNRLERTLKMTRKP